jgi:hypothetical protein
MPCAPEGATGTKSSQVKYGSLRIGFAHSVQMGKTLLSRNI